MNIYLYRWLMKIPAAIENINCLYMAYRGLVEWRGCEQPAIPFLSPYFLQDKTEISLNPETLNWERISDWVPHFRVQQDNLVWSGLYLAPIGERGFLIHLTVLNEGDKETPVFLGLRGSWQNAWHAINISKRMEVTRKVYPAAWGGGLMMEMARETSILCLGLHSSEPLQTESWKTNNYPELIAKQHGKTSLYFDAQDLNPVFWTLGNEYLLLPGEKKELTFYFGMAVDEVGAVTSALEMQRKGYVTVLENSIRWLETHRLSLSGKSGIQLSEKDIETLERKLNLNSFFNYFYSLGNTIDTEELVPVTSRSPRYYVSAAYWDRDVLYWSFPAVLMIDPPKAKEMLLRVFSRHIRNAGIHSHYIDGTMLEPGFELDELCAPIIALHHYVKATRDHSLFLRPEVQDGIDHILTVLKSKRHPQTCLYETFLLPSDDPAIYPYATYDNVLVLENAACFGDLCNCGQKNPSICRFVGLGRTGQSGYLPALPNGYPAREDLGLCC